VWAAFRAGSNTRTFQTDAEDSLLEEAEMTSSGVDMAPSSDAGMTRDAASPAHKDQDREAVTYNYVQFYIIFALASMYTGMLMTGWGSGRIEKDLIDVGWTSVAVKITSQWIAAALYMWTLVAPIILPDREF
jgi:hypothetical protein